MRLAPALLLVLVVPVLAETVRFETADGVTIVADLHRADGDAPTVICLPMYRHARSSYAPLVKPLLAKGMNVLALDLRGHGESAPDLAPKVEARDAALFNAMHEDVAAAVGYLLEKGLDTTRVGIVGASVGCSVAVDYAVRHPGDVRAVVLLTPGANYLGVPTLDHLKSWPGTRSFLFSSFEERKTTEPVETALAPFEGSNHMFFDLKAIHGTRMFGKVGGIEELIANFMESSMLGAADLVVPRAAGAGPRRKGGEVRVRVEDGELRVRVLGVDRIPRPAVFEVDGLEMPVPPGSEGAFVILDNDLHGTRGTEGDRAWVEIRLPRAVERKRLAVRLTDAAGGTVRLPGTGAFALRFKP